MQQEQAVPSSSILQPGMSIFLIEGQEGDLSRCMVKFLPIELGTATAAQDSYIVFFQDNVPSVPGASTSGLQRGYFYPCYGENTKYLTGLMTAERMASQRGRHARYDWPKNGLMAYLERPDGNIFVGIEYKDEICPVLLFEPHQIPCR